MALVKYKKLSKGRSVTIPKDLAGKAGMFPGTAVDLVKTADGILIRKHVPVCCICGTAENVKTVFGCMEICAECVKKIEKEYEENYAD